MILRLLTALGLGLTVAGCGSSPPTHYYTLDPEPTAARLVAAVPLQVVAVHIAPSLDRQAIVSETAANEIEISDQSRWSAPFDDMVRRVLTQDLAARLPEGMVVLPQQPAPPNVHKVVVDILQFEREATGDVVFDGSWSLLRAGSGASAVTQRVDLSEPAGTGYAAQAQAMSRILGKIADQIAASASPPG